MSLWRHFEVGRVQRFPRVSGDEPSLSLMRGANVGFSPRERG